MPCAHQFPPRHAADVFVSRVGSVPHFSSAVLPFPAITKATVTPVATSIASMVNLRIMLAAEGLVGIGVPPKATHATHARPHPGLVRRVVWKRERQGRVVGVRLLQGAEACISIGHAHGAGGARNVLSIDNNTPVIPKQHCAVRLARSPSFARHKSSVCG